MAAAMTMGRPGAPRRSAKIEAAAVVAGGEEGGAVARLRGGDGGA